MTEKTASAEAYILKAIRYGLTLAPVAGCMTWGDYRRAVADEDLRRGDRITLFDNEADENAAITGPVITFVHGMPPRETILVEHGGLVHGEALDRVDAVCPEGTVQVLDMQPGQFLVALNWDRECQERLLRGEGRE